MAATPIYRMPADDRWRGVQPYTGQHCRITYRLGNARPFDRHIEGTVVGASYHRTNGNSTGDLILSPGPEQEWRVAGGRWPLVSIALAHVGAIEVLDTQP